MDFQRTIIDWAAQQHGLTGLVLMATGLLYGLCGYRMIRYLVLAPAAGVGALIGTIVAAFTGLPPDLSAVGGVAVAGMLAALHPRIGMVLTGGATLALTAGYLCYQCHLDGNVILCAMLISCGVGILLTLVSHEPLTILSTTIIGATVFIVGFVGLSSATIPSLGYTFSSMARRQGFVIPVLLLMLCVTAYSYQASNRRGDITSGSPVRPPDA